jgi:hypothetical protein
MGRLAANTTGSWVLPNGTLSRRYCGFTCAGNFTVDHSNSTCPVPISALGRLF